MEWVVYAALAGVGLWLFQSRRAATPTVHRLRTETEDLEPDDYEQEVTGESHYQKAFEEICGPRCAEGEERPVDVLLVPESNNRFDANAVTVTVQGLKVGYLPKKDAEMYRKMFGTASVECDGLIVGGWERPGNQGRYGIRLAFKDLDED